MRSGDLPAPVPLDKGAEFTFTIRRGIGSDSTVSVNYDDFIDDVDLDDMILVDGEPWGLSVYATVCACDTLCMRVIHGVCVRV